MESSRFLLVQLIGPHEHAQEARQNMQETESLVGTYGGVVVEKLVQHRIHPHPNTYIGSGKVEEIRLKLKTQKIEVVLINGLVKPSQLFRMERQWWNQNSKIKVWDRLDLILAIFEKHAHSQEAKLQIELARIAHSGPRIYGLGGTVLSGQRGGIGQRGGGGETNIEMERRRMKQQEAAIRRQLAKLESQKQRRILYRQERGFGPVALVGYTSAGKTTLFNALTGKQKETRTKLFTTLDTAVGKMIFEKGQLPVLVADTIGFINHLPVQLVEAFRSTLMEAMAAKLLLHVIDATDRRRQEKSDTVEQILADLKITQPLVRVYTKMDLVSPARDKQIRREAKTARGWCVSATSHLGVTELKRFVASQLISDHN
ncbi:GTPase HflX [Microgenomates group bacterium RBG_16_45_19]|nr:MAG: GTPase HflX [Microgenomates group bacterium RBG_16_45_19]